MHKGIVIETSCEHGNAMPDHRIEGILIGSTRQLTDHSFVYVPVLGPLSGRSVGIFSDEYYAIDALVEDVLQRARPFADAIVAGHNVTH